MVEALQASLIILISILVGNLAYEVLAGSFERYFEKELNKKSIWYWLFEAGLVIIGLVDYDPSALTAGFMLCLFSVFLNLLFSESL